MSYEEPERLSNFGKVRLTSSTFHWIYHLAALCSFQISECSACLLLFVEDPMGRIFLLLPTTLL